jgi:hypothetical protein
MTKSKLHSCDVILSEMETLMGTEDVARLTSNQYADVETLYVQLKDACAIGDRKDAECMEKRIHVIIAEGAPAR